MKKLFSLIFLSNLIYAQNVLTFEQPVGTKTWTEGGVNWTYSNDFDAIYAESPKSGVGHGKTKSLNSAFLNADKNINISGLWLKFSNNTFSSNFVKGYDSLGVEMYSNSIQTSNFISGYNFLSLNWANIRKLKFFISQYDLPGAPPFFTPMYYDNYLFYDDLEYSIYSSPVDSIPPTIFCMNYNPNGFCSPYTIPDLRNNLMVSDNVSQWNTISKTQSITSGTVINKDSIIIFTATDEAGNTSSCSFNIKINDNTTLSQNISANTSYKDINNVFHYSSEIFQNIIPNSNGCDSIITTNLTVNQVPNVINFDVAPNLTTWTEDGFNWVWNGVSDKISNGSSKSGYGAGQASSNTSSKLVFPVNLNISKIWLDGRSNGSTLPFSAQMKGFDEYGNEKYNLGIDQTAGYEAKTLNWENVKSIGFSIPMGQMSSPGPEGFPEGDIPVYMDLFYDEVEYTIFTPVEDTIPPNISCIQNTIMANTCDSFSIPDLTVGTTVSDNVSSLQNITITQNISIGTVITKDTIIVIKATDEAGNYSTCNISLKTKKSSSSIQIVSSNTSFKDVLGVFHYSSGNFQVTIPNSVGCDSVISYNLTLNQSSGVLNFDVAPNLRTWNEDNRTWYWDGGADKIGTGSNSKNGNGHGVSTSSSNSKLVFPEKLNLSNIWILYNSPGIIVPQVMIKGYDENQIEIFNKPISSNSYYQEINLNWTNISSISFLVPNAMVMSGGSPFPVLTPQTIYFDEMGYSFISSDTVKPVVNCFGSIRLCENSVIPNYLNSLEQIHFTYSDNIGIQSISQAPMGGTIFNVNPGDSLSVTFTATDFAGNQSTCITYAKPLTKSYVSISETECYQYYSPAGKIYTQSGVYKDTLQNFAGCDSIITIELTIIGAIPLATDPQIIETSVCGNQKIHAFSSCSSGSIKWDYDFNYGAEAISNNTSDTVSLLRNYTYSVSCKIGSCSSNYKYFNTNGITYFPKPNAPILSKSSNSALCIGDSVDIIQGYNSCYGATILWNDGSNLSNLRVSPQETTTYTAICKTSTCESDTSSIEVSVNTFDDELAQIQYVSDSITCIGGFIDLIVSGCTSGYAKFSNQGIVPTTSPFNIASIKVFQNETIKVSCAKPGNGSWCAGPYTDSLKLFVNFDSIPKPAVSDSNISYCNKTQFADYLNTTCSRGHLIWEKTDILTSQVDNYTINAYSNFEEGDTLVLFCKDGHCKSKNIEHIVDYSLDFPEPDIQSLNGVICEGSTITLFSSMCVSSGFVPHWKIRSISNSTVQDYYSTQLTTTLNNDFIVELSCIFNNNCETKSKIFSPVFTDNQLITNIQTTKDTLCIGESFSVSFNLAEPFPIGNIFSIQLSDVAGSFLNPTLIGQSTSSNQTSILASLPDSIIASDKYRIRVVPSLTSIGSGDFLCYIKDSPITILGLGSADIYNNNVANCEGSQINLSAFSPYFNTYLFENEITFYKDDVNINSQNKSAQKNKFLKTYALNTDEGVYHFELTYKGCPIKSTIKNIIFNHENKAPLFPDTTIILARGEQLDLSSTCENGNIIYALSPYTFFSPYPSGVSNLNKMYNDTTLYSICNNLGCLSDFRKIEVSVFDPINAPEIPFLDLNVDSICSNDFNTQIIKFIATGCTGAINWFGNRDLSRLLEIDNVEPYELMFQGLTTVYATCTENGIVSKGAASISLHITDNSSYQFPIISPATFVDQQAGYELIIGTNSKINLKVEDLTSEGSQDIKYKYCKNGTVKWFDSNNYYLSSGFEIDTMATTSNIILFVSCEKGGKCEDGKRAISIIVKDTLTIIPVNKINSICGSGSIDLKTTGCPSNFTKWYLDSLSTNEFHIGSNYFSNFYENQTSENQIIEFYVACDNGVFQTPKQVIKLIVSPAPKMPIIENTSISCNTPVGLVTQPVGCNSAEDIIWFQGSALYYYTSNTLFHNLGQNNIQNYNFSNTPREYNVACKNNLSSCESQIKKFTMTFDCTLPPAPIISIQNISNLNSNKKPTDSNSSIKLNEFCIGDQILLKGQNCINGTIFWSDGFVGSERIYVVKNGQANISANCKLDNYLKSSSSNSINIISKPTPLFSLIDSIYNITNVDLTAQNIFNSSYFPQGSIISYYNDSMLSQPTLNPFKIESSGIVYVKALAPNNCSFSDNLVVVIDKCGKIIGLYSPNDDTFSGTIDEKSRNQINAMNKINGNTRAIITSEKSILMDPGFEVKVNQEGVFLAEIGKCEN